MRLVIFLHLIFVITACSENKKWPSQQEQQYAPNTKTELGFIVSNVTTDEVADILEKYPHAKVRVIHPRQSIYEFYGLTEIQIHTDLPQALTAKNQFFVPQNYDLQSPSENTDLQVDQCANGRYLPHAQIQFKNLTTSGSPTIELGQNIYLDASASKANEKAPSALQFRWAIKPPEGSHKSTEYHYLQDWSYVPDSMGNYQVQLLVQDERKKCAVASAIFNVTANRELTEWNTLDETQITDIKVQLNNFSHLTEWQMQKVWQQATGKNQLIAIIDSGINYNHFALKQNIYVNTAEIPNNQIDDDQNGFVDDYLGYDFTNNDVYPYDDHGHGSHVAGLAAANVFGIAKDAKLLAIKAMSPSGGDIGTLSGAIYYAVDQEAKIINISLGNYGENHPHLQLAINYAEEHGALIVAGAGNGDKFFGLPINTDIVPNYPSSLDNENIVSVTAKSNNGLPLAPYANFGVKTVDIVAPGGDSDQKLLSAFIENPAGLEIIGRSGTSMATPLVSGLIALLWEMYPQLSVSKVRSLLMSSGPMIPELTNKVGSGRYLNAWELIDNLQTIISHTQD